MTSEVQTQQESLPIVVKDVAGREDVERFETSVMLPVAFQYVIPGRKKVNDVWVEDNKVGITSDGYDYLNRVMGVTFSLPQMVPDVDGRMSNNPIHRPDYLYMRMGAVWYNEVGQLVAATEDLEVDYKNIYEAARLETYDSEILLDDKRQPVFENGHPVVVLKSTADEKKAAKRLTMLRTMGLRYAQTVLRTRLLKVAIGVKTLPGQQPSARSIRIVGYRDRMDPVARLEQAEQGLAAVFSGARPEPDDMRPLSDEELRSIEPDMADLVVEDEVAMATGTATVEQQQRSAPMTDAERYEILQREREEAR